MTISGIVLAGGHGRRLGRDKSAAAVLGVSLLDRACALLEPLTDEIVIVTRDGIGNRGRARIIRDETPERGPMAGLLTGLRAVRSARVLVIPVDMPLLVPELLSHLIEVSAGWEITVPHWGLMEPLVGVYATTCLPALARCVENLQTSVAEFVRLAGLTVRFVTGDELHRFGDPARLFLNVNTPEDLLRAESLLREGVSLHSA